MGRKSGRGWHGEPNRHSKAAKDGWKKRKTKNKSNLKKVTICLSRGANGKCRKTKIVWR